MEKTYPLHHFPLCTLCADYLTLGFSMTKEEVDEEKIIPKMTKSSEGVGCHRTCFSEQTLSGLNKKSGTQLWEGKLCQHTHGGARASEELRGLRSFLSSLWKGDAILQSVSTPFESQTFIFQTIIAPHSLWGWGDSSAVQISVC